MSDDYVHDTAFDEPIESFDDTNIQNNSPVDDSLFLDPSLDQYFQSNTAQRNNTQANNVPSSSMHRHIHTHNTSANNVIDLTSPTRITPYRNRLSLHTHSQYTNNENQNHTNLLDTLNQSCDYDNTCCICLESITDECKLNNCTHKFCVQCIVQWSKTATSCPSCRAEFNEIQYIKYNTPSKKHKTVEFIRVESRQQVDAESVVDAYYCEICEGDDDEANIVLCDYIVNTTTNEACNAGYHIYCLRPQLRTVPSGIWYCPTHQRNERALQRTRTNRTEQDNTVERVNSNAVRGVTRTQPSRRRLRRANNNHNDSDENTLQHGYDTDDGFVVPDDTIIYATQPSRSRNQRNNTHVYDDEFELESFFDDTDNTASTASESESENHTLTVSRARARAQGHRQRRQQNSATAPNRRQRSTQQSRDHETAIRQHNQRMKRSDTSDNSTERSNRTTGSRSNNNRSQRSNTQSSNTINAMMNAVTQRINNNTSSSTSVHNRPSTSTAVRPYNNSTFPTAPTRPLAPTRVINNLVAALGMPANDIQVSSTSNHNHKRLRRAADIPTSSTTGGTVSPYFQNRH